MAAQLMFLGVVPSFALKLQADHVRTDPGEEPIYAWMSFGRVGSTMMRNIIATRAKQHGWTKDWGGGQGLCKAKPLDYNSESPPPCGDTEDTAIVQTQWKFCERLAHVSARPCKYLTLLRDPIDRTVSQYNWFCRACSEDGIQCTTKEKIEERKRDQAKDPTKTPMLTCPDMSLVDYTRHYGNEFVEELSGREIECARATFRMGWEEYGPEYRDCVVRVNEDHLQKSIDFIKDPNNLVLQLEKFWQGTETEPRGLDRLASFLNDPEVATQKEVHVNENVEHYEPTEEELAEMRQILALDIRLVAKLEHKGRSRFAYPVIGLRTRVM